MSAFDDLRVIEEQIKAAKAAGQDASVLERMRQEIAVKFQEEARAAWWNSHLKRILQ